MGKIRRHTRFYAQNQFIPAGWPANCKWRHTWPLTLQSQRVDLVYFRVRGREKEREKKRDRRVCPEICVSHIEKNKDKMSKATVTADRCKLLLALLYWFKNPLRGPFRVSTSKICCQQTRSQRFEQNSHPKETRRDVNKSLEVSCTCEHPLDGTNVVWLVDRWCSIIIWETRNATRTNGYIKYLEYGTDGEI